MPKYSRTHRSIYKPKGRRYSRRHLYEMPMKGGGPDDVAGESPAIAGPNPNANSLSNNRVEGEDDLTNPEEQPLPAGSNSEEKSEEEKSEEEKPEEKKPEGPEQKKGIMGKIYDAVTGASIAASDSFKETTKELSGSTKEDPSVSTASPLEREDENTSASTSASASASASEESGFANTEDQTRIEELKQENKELKDKVEDLTTKLFQAKDDVIDVLKQSTGLSTPNSQSMESPEQQYSGDFTSATTENEGQNELSEEARQSELSEEARQNELSEGADGVSEDQMRAPEEGTDVEGVTPESVSQEEMAERENDQVMKPDVVTSESPSSPVAPAGPAPLPMQGGKSKRRRRTIRKSKRRYRYVYA